jgi:hypothetical protein
MMMIQRVQFVAKKFRILTMLQWIMSSNTGPAAKLYLKMQDWHIGIAIGQDQGGIDMTTNRQIRIVDAQIDRLVYELYGLTEEEINVVEGDLK